MPLARSINSLTTWSTGEKVKTLEKLSMDVYLSFLEDACAVYIRLLAKESRLLKVARDNMMHVLKSQLSSSLSGIMSTSIRQEMIREVKNSGRFPSPKFHNQYHTDCKVVHYDSEGDRTIMEEIRKHGQLCSSICCTGAFIVETMLCILMNEDVREIRFDGTRSDRFIHPKKPVKKFVPFQIPAVLAHYAMAVDKWDNYPYEKKPCLERFVVKNVDILSRTYAMKNSMFEVLTMYEETMNYLEIPGWLSEASQIGFQYGGFSEHLMMSITDIFSTLDKFPKLTEICLGPEACSTMFKMGNSSGNCISFALFHGIGLACPKLRVLDLSLCTNVAAENLLYLFFHDTYVTLHKYLFMPKWKVENDVIVQCEKFNEDYDVIDHDLERYCPYCFDQWAPNGVRNGCGHAEIKIPVIDDRLYEDIMDQHGSRGKYHLPNVIKASHLVESVTAGHYVLEREGLAPYEVDFVPPKPQADGIDCDFPFYLPDKIKYKRDPNELPILNKLCQSLEYLILNVDVFYPKHTIVPFMLYALPKIKSFGNITLVHALRMIRAIPALNGIKAENLEELEYIQNGLDFYRSDFAWASDEIYDMVDEFHRRDRLGDDTPEDVLRQRLTEDVLLISQECPNLKKLDISLFGEKTYLYSTDDAIWQPLAEKLTKLVSVTLIGHKWSETEALMRAIGQRLKRIYLALRGFIPNLEDNLAQPPPASTVPKLEQLLDLCPQLEDLTISFGPLTLNVSDEALLAKTPKYNLTEVTVHTYMTKKAFVYLWASCPRLQKIKVVNEIVTGENYPHGTGDAAEFSENDVEKLFKSNAMGGLIDFRVAIRLKNILTAKLFIDKLLNVKSVSNLVIRVQLPQDNYPTQEQMLVDIAHQINRMKQFKEFCNILKKQSGRQIKWSWARVGILESLGNLGLHNLDSDESLDE